MCCLFGTERSTTANTNNEKKPHDIRVVVVVRRDREEGDGVKNSCAAAAAAASYTKPITKPYEHEIDAYGNAITHSGRRALRTFQARFGLTLRVCVCSGRSKTGVTVGEVFSETDPPRPAR